MTDIREFIGAVVLGFVLIAIGFSTDDSIASPAFFYAGIVVILGLVGLAIRELR